MSANQLQGVGIKVGWDIRETCNIQKATNEMNRNVKINKRWEFQTLAKDKIYGKILLMMRNTGCIVFVIVQI